MVNDRDENVGRESAVIPPIGDILSIGDFEWMTQYYFGNEPVLSRSSPEEQVKHRENLIEKIGKYKSLAQAVHNVSPDRRHEALFEFDKKIFEGPFSPEEVRSSKAYAVIRALVYGACSTSVYNWAMQDSDISPADIISLVEDVNEKAKPYRENEEDFTQDERVEFLRPFIESDEGKNFSSFWKAVGSHAGGIKRYLDSLFDDPLASKTIVGSGWEACGSAMMTDSFYINSGPSRHLFSRYIKDGGFKK